MKTRILLASVEFVDQPFLKPLQLSSGFITKATEARVSVSVEVGGKQASGRGSIYLSDLWAWPGAEPSRAEKDAAMRAFCERLAGDLACFCGGEAAHPLELGLRLHEKIKDAASEMPLMARTVCASPFDAAIHDAVGQALGISAFAFYDVDAEIPTADHWFPESGAVASIRRLIQQPRESLPAWWVVGAKEDLESETRPEVLLRGITRFKIKTLGKDNTEDARRTSEIYRAALAWGIASPELSIDSNEGNPDSSAVLDYLERLQALDPEAYDSLTYLEQPTSRLIVEHPQDWRAVAERKSVYLDEGLTSMELLPLVVEQGWSGLAIKTCKGHSFALVSAAWAHERGLGLVMQDLSNPGFAAIHSFLFSAYTPTLNGIELNSTQYTPAANEEWLPKLSGLFQPREGVHRFDGATHPGLSSHLR